MEIPVDNIETITEILDDKTPDQLLNTYTELGLRNLDIEQKIEEFKAEHKEVFDKLNEMLESIVDNTFKQSAIKEELVDSMNKANIDSIANKVYRVKYIAATTRHDFDKAKFKAENEELYNSYLKETNVKAFVKVSEV